MHKASTIRFSIIFFSYLYAKYFEMYATRKANQFLKKRAINSRSSTS